jgi:DNA-directed RNA polymerase subunit RPC12/RpoP
MTCVKCGKRLPLSDSLIDKKQTCRECDERYATDMAMEKDKEERRKAAHVSQVIARHPELRSKIMARLGISEFGNRLFVEYGIYQEICRLDERMTHAKNLETARRFEDAAKVYESIGLWKEAGLAREKKVARTVKHVSVNLNDLLDRVRDGGLAISYKCRSCGAGLSVDGSSNANGLRFCPYCGTAADTETLTSIISNALK